MGFQRLSEFIKPTLYNVHLWPNIETFKFKGNVVIDIDVSKPVDQIVLNGKELEIESVSINDKSTEFVYSDDDETLTIKCPLDCGSHVINISYIGSHNDKRMGFYRTKHVNLEGVTEWAVATHFEPVQARYALPCFDEPAIRAKFNFKVTVPSDLTSLCCMEVIDKSVDGANTTYSYATTPSMSTYLLAVCCGKYDFVEGSTKSGIKVRIYANRGEGPNCNFALEVAIKCLDWYEDYFGIKYPLNKCDLIGIPDFTGGAMENWGLITFRSSCILFDPEKTSDSQKERIAIIIAHELAHMWFGNLVTVGWWTHLWLKEGFASYLQYLSIDNLFPEWKVWDNMVHRAYITARGLDSLKTSHPVEVEVADPGAINEIFDTISYLKGCSIIRMLYAWLGQENMRLGLSKYLDTFSYGAASTEDLWGELGKVTGEPVEEVMANWTGKLGYPIIHVESQSDSSKSFNIRQEKFNLDGSKGDAGTIWQVPIDIQTSKGVQKILLSQQSTSAQIEGYESSDWLNINANCAGFFITKLPDSILQKNLENVQNFCVTDRLKLVYDLLQLIQAGYSSSSSFLTMMQYFKDERNYYVWDLLTSGLNSLKSLAKRVGKDRELNQLVISCMKPCMDSIGLEAKTGEDYSMPKLRALLVYHLGICGDPDIRKFILGEFENIKKGAASVDTQMKTNIQYVVGYYGENFNDLKNLHANSQMASEKNSLEYAIGHAKEPTLIGQSIEFALSENVRNCDQLYILSELAATSPEGLNAIWEMISNRIEFLKENYGGQFQLSSFFKGVLGRFSDEESIAKVEEFFAKNPVENSKMAISQGLEKAKLKVQWYERDLDDIRNFF